MNHLFHVQKLAWANEVVKMGSAVVWVVSARAVRECWWFQTRPHARLQLCLARTWT